MAKNDPLGCPFCGGFQVDINRTNPNACWVSCANDACAADTRSHRTRTGAIANWNRRTSGGSLQTASIREDDDRDRYRQEARERMRSLHAARKAA